MNEFTVIATLNHHLLEKKILQDFVEAGANVFRINGSHVKPDELKAYGEAVRAAVGNKVRLLVDLPGNKIRTAVFSQPIKIAQDKLIELRADQLNFPQFFDHLRPGDILLANDSLFKFRVESIKDGKAVLYSFNHGLLGSNKGVHLVGRSVPAPFLFERDQQLIKAARECDYDMIGLSFVRKASEVREAKALIAGSKLTNLVKLETREAVENVDEIIQEADEFLVDRGDLSCDVGIESIDDYQKYILRAVKQYGKRVYFATQFFHFMVKNNVPLIAEACGMSDAVRSGVDGIQLSEETAVGEYPLQVLGTAKAILNKSRNSRLKLPRVKDSAPVLWLTGRSGAGKTTISKNFVNEARRLGLQCALIDGDTFRNFWGNDVGYSEKERIQNQRNIIFTAYQAATCHDLVVVASLSPFKNLRELAREKIPAFHEVHVKVSFETCAKRDPKGHYKKAGNDFSATNDSYEEPQKPDCLIETEKMSATEAAQVLKKYALNWEALS